MSDKNPGSTKGKERSSLLSHKKVGREDKWVRPTVPLEKIQDDHDFVRNYVANIPELEDDMVTDEGMEKSQLWQNHYDRYLGQQEAKKIIKELLEKEIMGRMQKEMGITFEDEELKKVYAILEEETEELARTDAGSNEIATFITEYNEHLENVEKVKQTQKVVEAEIKRLPNQTVSTGEAYIADYDQYLDSLKDKTFFVFKSGETKRMEKRIKGFGAGSGEDDRPLDPDQIKALRDKYDKIITDYKNNQAKLNDPAMRMDALFILNEYNLAQKAREKLQEVGAKKARDLMRPKTQEAPVERPGQIEEKAAREKITELSNLLKKLALADLPSLENIKAELVNVAQSASLWAVDKKDKYLDKDDRELMKKILDDASKITEAAKLDVVDPETKAQIDSIIESELAKLAKPVPEEISVPHAEKKSTEYLSLHTKYTDYYDNRVKELEAMLPDGEKHNASKYVINFLKDEDSFLKEAEAEIKAEVDRRFAGKYGIIETRIKNVKSKEAKTEHYNVLGRELLKAYRLAGENEQGKLIVGKKIVDELKKLVSDPEMKGSAMFIQLALKKFKKEINYKE